MNRTNHYLRPTADALERRKVVYSSDLCADLPLFEGRFMPSYRFYQVDVFTNQAFGGNPLAVFPDAEGLSSNDMLRLAREMNLSETTFVFPPSVPGADYK